MDSVIQLAQKSLLIFTSNRPEGYGSGDLYVSFRKEDGNWTAAKNMGDKINTPGSEYCAMLSPDARYLLFTGVRRFQNTIPEKPLTYNEQSF